MKTLLKAIGVILLCAALILVVLSITGLDPKERRAGLWLKGNVVTTPVNDWSFTDPIQTIKTQTNTWYMIPHSVTTFCVAYNGHLYLTSVYRAGIEFPHGRGWNENIARDPHVRLKIGNNVYDRRLEFVSDPAEKAAVLQAKAKKYPQQKLGPGATTNVFRVMPD
jgi:hypothetical protein